MKKIRSGQAFLYRKNGMQSTVIDVRMRDKVCGTSLKKALDTSILRYPYLKSRMVERDGDIYLVDNSMKFIVKETSKLHSLGSAEVNYHLIDITYTANKICIAFHHGLCDGRGIKPFVETLIYYYCAYKYETIFKASGIRLAGEDLLEGETKEPCEKKFEVKDDFIMPEIIKDGYDISEENEDKYYRYEINVNSDEFMKFVKENNATPAIAVSLLMSKAIRSACHEVDKPIITNMASDMREALGMDNVYKNCVSSVYLPYSNSIENLSFKEQATLYRKMINEQKQEEVVKLNANMMIGLSDKLDELNSFEARKSMMSFFNNMKLNTFVLSYLGKTNLGECDKYVDSMNLYSSGSTGIIVNMMATSKYITINFLQSFKTDKYICALIETMKEVGIEFNVSEKIEFNTPEDSCYKNFEQNLNNEEIH